LRGDEGGVRIYGASRHDDAGFFSAIFHGTLPRFPSGITSDSRARSYSSLLNLSAMNGAAPANTLVKSAIEAQHSS
jgi:hypothetical protein